MAQIVKPYDPSTVVALTPTLPRTNSLKLTKNQVGWLLD